MSPFAEQAPAKAAPRAMEAQPKSKRWSRIDWNFSFSNLSKSDLSIDDDDRASWNVRHPDLSSDDVEGADDAPRPQSGPATGGPSRYDPAAIVRVGDLNDLVEEEDGDEEAPAAELAPRGARSLRGVFVPIVLIVVVVGIVAGAAGYNYYRFDRDRRSTARAARPREAPELQEWQDSQRLLDVAERVVLACEELRQGYARATCANACAGRLCCVDDVASCAHGGDCAAYAGCAALLEPSP